MAAMTKSEEKYSLFKEMLIAFIIGGSLGLLSLAIAVALVEFLKK